MASLTRGGKGKVKRSVRTTYKELVQTEASRRGDVDLELLGGLQLEGGSVWILVNAVTGEPVKSKATMIRLPDSMTPQRSIYWGAVASRLVAGATGVDTEGIISEGSSDELSFAQVHLRFGGRDEVSPELSWKRALDLRAQLWQNGGGLFCPVELDSDEPPDLDLCKVKGRYRTGEVGFRLPSHLSHVHLVFWGAAGHFLYPDTSGVDTDFISQLGGNLKVAVR